MSTQIQEVLERTKVLQTILSEAPESWNPRTVPAKMIQRRSAEEEMKGLSETYKRLLTESLVKVYATGTNALKLADFKLLAQEFPSAVVIDADALYKRVATPAVPIYNQSKRLNLDVTLIIENDIMVAAQEQKIEPTDFPRIAPRYLEATFDNPEEGILNLVRETVEKVFGTNLQQALLTKLAIAEAVRLEVSEAPVFLVLIGARENEVANFEARGFFGGRPYATINVDTAKNAEGSLRAATNKFMKKTEKPAETAQLPIDPSDVSVEAAAVKSTQQ